MTTLRSEFGRVRLAVEDSHNGARLLIEDERTLQRIYLDPLELECLAMSSHADLTSLLNPGRFTDLVEAAESQTTGGPPGPNAGGVEGNGGAP